MLRMDPAPLRDERLLLRAPEDRDTTDIVTACQDAQLQRYIPVPVPYLREHAESWIAQAAPMWAERAELRWAVTDAAPGGTERFLGVISLHPEGDGMREIGYWTTPWARRRGYTTGAVRLVCRFGLGPLGLARIEWLAAVGNEGSRRVALKAGFVMEGVLRSRLVVRDVRHDAWIAGLLPGDLS